MSDGDALVVNENVSIPRSELEVRATRSGGPGGQHVNTSSTRIELRWNLAGTGALDESTRERVRAKLASRIDAEGFVRVVASEHRSQLRNREEAEQRLVELIHKALIIPKARKRTKPSRAARQARLDEKRKQSKKKELRRRPTDD